MAHQLVRDHPAHVAEHEVQPGVLQGAAVLDLDEVGQVRFVAPAYPGDVGVEFGTEAAVAGPRHHLAQKLDIARRVALPVGRADMRQVRVQTGFMHFRLADQKDLGFSHSVRLLQYLLIINEGTRRTL